MRVVEFKDRHVHFVSEWLLKRSLSAELSLDLPAVGFIALEDESAIAAGFLRQVEGDYLIVDSLISNPSQAPEARNAAIDLIVLELIKMAKFMGISKIFANSTDINTLERAKKHGFKLLPNVMMSLDLRKEG